MRNFQPKKPTTRKPGAAGRARVARKAALASLLSLAAVWAADINVQSDVFKRPVTFQENGDVNVRGRVFTAVPQYIIPNEGPLVVEDSSGWAVSAVIDNHVFLSGGMVENQNTFPGKVKVKRANGTVIASFDENGNFFLDEDRIAGANCAEPRTELWKWNDQYNIRTRDNCYNYGNNQLTYTFAQPGRASGAQAFDMTVTAVRNAALSDGLTWVGWNFPGNNYTCPGAGTLVYMTVDPGNDYHWYRLDKADGKWTHKPGGTPATDLDASNNPITNPSLANRNYGGLNYTDNGGYYCTCGSDANVW